MDSFQFQISSTRVVFGLGCAAQVGTHAKNLGIRRALLVTDNFMSTQPAFRGLREALEAVGIASEVFDQVELDPGAASIEHAANVYRSGAADGIVALGGGSAMDTAKGLGVLVSANAAKIAPFYFGGTATPVGIPPLICMPTTAGTGSEITFVAIVSEPETQRKLLVRHPSIAPTIALIDPMLSATMPAALTASTAVDALAHALEALTSTMASPLSDILAHDAIPRILANLPLALSTPTDLAARSALSYAALAAGYAFLSGRVHLGHAVGHALGGAYHVPHGLACIVCMPAILDLLQQHAPAITAKLGTALGNAPGQALQSWLSDCQVPRLGQLLAPAHPSIDELVAVVGGEQRLIGLSHYAPTAAEWAAMFEQSW
jgi:alcohol dehydrogenase class IV